MTRTFGVRVGLDNPPAAMRLGSTVNGAVDLSSSVVVAVPASALTSSAGRPAVWIVDQAKSTVVLRPIDVLRFEPGRVVISQGLEPGDVVVTAGTRRFTPDSGSVRSRRRRRCASLCCAHARHTGRAERRP